MSLPRVVTLALLFAVLAPGTATAGASTKGVTGEVRLLARDEPLAGARALAGHVRVLPPRKAPFRFNLIGLHWRGVGDVWFRTGSKRGRWSEWRPARPEAEDLPDRGTPEAKARRGWTIGNPHWTGPARWVQYRVSGRLARLRAHFVWSPPGGARRLTIAGTPNVIPRSSWGADEAIVRAVPLYAGRVAFAVVHHTAGRNAATPEESAAIVRAIQAYHVRGNGWNDMGYNFLVDRFGQVFEGRGGGVDENVVGAHAEGFNTGSVGIAVIGSYGTVPISPEARSALAALLAWRLDVAHVDPLTRLSWLSGGNTRFPAGVPVSLGGVSAHRDTGFTSCPGSALYAELGEIAGEAAALGLPKLYEPAAEGAIEGPIRFTARLSDPLPWTLTVTDAAGIQLAGGSGTGPAVDWTWDASAVPPGSYAYTIEAGSNVRPAHGSIAGPVALALTGVRANPAVLTPNEDGVDDETELSFSLTVPASVTVSLVDAAGAAVTTLVPERSFPTGTARIPWNGATAEGAAVLDGRYRIAVTARANGRQVYRSASLVVDRTLGAFAVAREAVSPNGDGRLDRLELGFDLTREAEVRVRVMAGKRPVASVFAGALAGGRQTLSWSGRKRLGRVPDGDYTALVEATTALGTRRLALPFTIDTEPPRLLLLSARAGYGATKLRFTLSEPARVKVWYDESSFAIERDAGSGGFWQRVVPRWARLVAWDAAGNASAAVAVRVRA